MRSKSSIILYFNKNRYQGNTNQILSDQRSKLEKRKEKFGGDDG